ncbi:IS66 family transposase [Pseudovibrio sp. Tun.PSC04-5.I4]|uniref:IS66 family transposase n=1 Tax=Pseudovibrio sp. Tun.PSC04-5.I4 TaxID=1798213 RepID=UPI001AD94A2E|nr:IS66 family transposase [Pseudovibrio sp. Tun.PSC04-5.I4]
MSLEAELLESSLTNAAEQKRLKSVMQSELVAERTAHSLSIQSRDTIIADLRLQLDGHKKHRFGVRSESLDQLALELVLEEHEIAQAAETGIDEGTPTAEQEAKPPRAPRQRKPFPKDLKRTQTRLTPGDACAECGGSFKELGTDVMEELEYVPGHYIVNQIIRPRLACTCCETVTQAEVPSRPIPKSFVGPALMAHILTCKYGYHLPLYRQSQIFTNQSIDLSGSLLSSWVGKSTKLLERLSDAIRDHVTDGKAIFMDDTTVKLLEKGKGRGKNKTKTARLWVYARDERAWSSTSPPAVWYQFSTSREAKHPSKHLQSYEGFAHADAYAGYNDVYRTGRVKEMACMVHIRREFVKVYDSYKLPVAKEAINRIADLYGVEKRARGKSPADRVALRQKDAKPIFDDLEDWLRTQLNKISAKTPLAKAIRYALTRLPKARPYLDHGFLELDNNTAERAVRPVTLGRKNYLFMGSEAGGKSAAIAYTLIETCKLNKINPEAWLAWVLERIQDHPANRINELMPWQYQAIIDVQKNKVEAKTEA